ncbi:MAG: hypothetical protein GY851_21285 [bacterium]|nr:hypothetical protein [bacterium]
MIRINLLPHHLRPIKRTPVPYILSAVVFLGVVLYLVNGWLQTESEIRRKNNDYQVHIKALDDLKDVVEESNQLEQRKIQLADKVQVIDEIVSDRIIWSRQLHQLSELIPENFWYSNIKLGKKKIPVKVPQPDPNDPNRVIMKYEMRDRPILIVKGYVVEDNNGSKTVNPLVDEVTENVDFASMFRLEPVQFNDTEFEKYPVRAFELQFLIKRGGAPK